MASHRRAFSALSVGLLGISLAGFASSEPARADASRRIVVEGAGAEDASVVPRAGGLCPDCPHEDFIIDPPTFVFAFHDGSLAPDDCNWYRFEADGRYRYDFWTCRDTPPHPLNLAFSEFPTFLALFDATCTEIGRAEANCWDGSAFMETWPQDGTHYLQIRGMSGEPGAYRLGYARNCPRTSGCQFNEGRLVPMPDCRLTGGEVDFCLSSAWYGMELLAGCTYHFSFCPASCPVLPAPGADFDAILRLYMDNGVEVADDGATCGDGEIEYTVSPGGSGHYCLQVAREIPGGGDRFQLAAWVACEPPESLAVRPDAGATSAPDCSREEQFIASVTGIGPFDWEWSIVPPAGGSATPSSGVATTPGNELRWDSLVQGVGSYEVSVSAENVGGSIAVTTPYVLIDQGPPNLTIQADPAACAIPQPIRLRAVASPAPGARPPQWTAPTLDELATTLLASPDPREAGLALAMRLALDASEVRVGDRRDLSSQLSCASPCSGRDVLAVASSFDELAIACDTGEVSLRTGGERFVLVAPSALDSEPDLRACVFYPRGEPDAHGIEAEWTSSDGTRVRQEVVAFGSSPADAGVRLTTSASLDHGPARSDSILMPARILALGCAPVSVTTCRGGCVQLEAEASDACGAATLTYLGASRGAPACIGNPCLVAFPDEGEFEYGWEATDAAGNSVTCWAIVTVEGCNEAPSCSAGAPAAPTCRAIPIEGGSVSDPDGDAIAWSWTSDNPDVTIDPPSGTIPAGMGARVMPPVTARLAPQASACAARAMLTLTVDDGRGGVSSCATSVAFSDGEAPSIAQGGAYSACLWSPNHWYACFSPEELGLVVRDACSEPVTWSIASCSSDQPDGGRDRRWNGDGRTVDDCVVESDGHSFCVRSERAGTGPNAQAGRHYSVAIVATDACGNQSAELAIATIHVPHDRSPRDPDCIDVTRVGCRSLPCSP